MKKLLLVVPVMFALAACGGSGETTTSATASTSTSTTSTSTTPVGPVVADVTINLTASGIDTYEDNHAFIWISTDALGSASSWGAAKMSQDTTDQNKWSVVIEDFELEQAISYNFVYGTESGPDWTNGKNIIEGDYSTIVTEEGKTSYDVTATFHVPTVTGTADIKYYVNPKLWATSEGAKVDLTDGIYVWAWNNLDSNDVKLEKQLDGTWLFARDGVELLDGVAKVQLTCVLGSAFAPNWTQEGGIDKYKQGKWESGTWQPWNNGITFEFTSETTEFTEDIFFKAEPEIVTGPTLTINYFEASASTVWPTSRWLNYSYTDSTLGSSTKSWAVNPEWDEGLGGFTCTFQFTEDLVYLEMGVYITHDAFVGISTTKRLAVSFTADVASFSLTVEYAGDATAYAGVVTDAVGCTVE